MSKKVTSMLPLTKRCIESAGKGLYKVYFCRNQQSFAAASLALKCLEWQPAQFDGLEVNLDQLGENYNIDMFSVRLKESILYWKESRKTSAWMKVPIAQSHLIPVAFDHGFIYHHAVSDYAMLLKWLPQFEENKVPPFATHQVGVAGVVLNSKTSEVLVVQDKYTYKVGKTRRPKMWKFPGGLSNEQENFEETVIREVREETGVEADFRSVLMFRQQHQMKNAFDRSDMYIVCRLEPLSREINHCEEEIDRCDWMKLSTLLTSPEVGPLTKLVGRLVVHGLKNGFENVDMVQNRMRSWINPEQTVSLYHRYLPN